MWCAKLCLSRYKRLVVITDTHKHLHTLRRTLLLSKRINQYYPISTGIRGETTVSPSITVVIIDMVITLDELFVCYPSVRVNRSLRSLPPSPDALWVGMASAGLECGAGRLVACDGLSRIVRWSTAVVCS